MSMPTPIPVLKRPGSPCPALPLALAVATGMLAPGAVQAQHSTDDRHAGHAHHGSASRAEHPDPRPGITAADVLPAERFRKRVARIYNMARKIPQVLDGIYCHCDCHERDGLRSLLSCFENEMASTCGVCQGQAKLAHELHREGKSLEEIRAAIDAEYGS